MSKDKIATYSEKMLNVNDLLLDLNNPRYPNQPDQQEAISTMVSNNGKEIFNMAESIVRNGFFSLELPCVYPSKDKNKYIVLEGNRRIAALKILNMPELANGSKEFKKFRTLASSNNPIPTEIKCAVFSKAEDCETYIFMRHGHGGDGATLKKWDAVQTRRAEQARSGKKNDALQILEYVKEHGKLSEEHEQMLNQHDSFNITNLERLTDSAIVREMLQIIDNDLTKSSKGATWLVQVWQRIIEIILDGQFEGNTFSVKNIYDASLQKQFLEKVFRDLETTDPSSHTVLTTDDPQKSINEKTLDENSQNDRTKDTLSKPKRTKTRGKGLIANSFNLHIDKPAKIVNIINELKRIDAEKFNNCCGVMFRVFMELSVNNYMKKHKIKNTDKKGNELRLKAKINEVVIHLEKNKTFDRNQLKALKNSTHPDHTVSAETLNTYVHSDTYIPSGKDLKDSWDSLQHILEAMWEK